MENNYKGDIADSENSQVDVGKKGLLGFEFLGDRKVKILAKNFLNGMNNCISDNELEQNGMIIDFGEKNSINKGNKHVANTLNNTETFNNSVNNEPYPVEVIAQNNNSIPSNNNTVNTIGKYFNNPFSKNKMPIASKINPEIQTPSQTGIPVTPNDYNNLIRQQPLIESRESSMPPWNMPPLATKSPEQGKGLPSNENPTALIGGKTNNRRIKKIKNKRRRTMKNKNKTI